MSWSNRGKIEQSPFVVRDCEHPFVEDLIANGAGVVDPQLPVLTKVSCLVDALRLGGSNDLVEKLWAQFVPTAGPVNTEIAWTRDEVLVGSVNFRSHLVSFPIYIVVLLLVNHLNGMLSQLLSRVVGWPKAHQPFVQFGVWGVWCGIEGLHTNVGDGHFSLGCRDRVRSFLQGCQARFVSARVSCGCSGWFGVPFCCFWWVICVGWELRRVQSQAGCVPDIRYASLQAIPAKGILFRLWIFGSVLQDGICCDTIEEGRAPRLNDVTFRSSSCHSYWRAVDAFASWGHQQHRGSVASHRGLPWGDWDEDRGRQLSGIIYSPLSFQLHFLSHFHPVVSF